MSRRTILALVVSLAAHLAAGSAMWHWTVIERSRRLPERVAVVLSPPAPPAPETPQAAPTPPAPAAPPPREARPLPPVAGPEPRPVTAPPPWEPRPYPRPRAPEESRLRSPRRHADAASDWWSRRSAVALVEVWREGGAPRDSTLDRHVTMAERILASTNRGLNENFLRLRRRWKEEQFREKYAESFPPMGQIPAEPEP